jgi:large subunit ribosomal protein L21
MFAVVRTGGKQYRVAPGDKIVVEKMAGDAGDRIDITDVLLAGDGSDLKSVDGLTVAAEIIAQAKGEKVTVFKKRRRHNYRRKKGHRQQHTILRIVAIGDQKAEGGDKKKAAAKKAPAPSAASDATPAEPDVRGQVDTVETANPAPAAEAPAKPVPSKAEGADKPKKAAAKPETPSTENAAPAKGGAKKGPKGSKAE